MKIIFLLFLPLLLCAENLIVNGNVEKGEKKQPSGWGILDQLTAQWSKKGKRGRGILLDSSVLLKDKKEFINNPDAYTPSQPQGPYDAVGATEGAWAFAPPVDVVKDDPGIFILSCDVKAPVASGELCYPQILIRGFQKITEKTAGQNSSWFFEHYGDGIGYSEMFGSDAQRRSSRIGDYLMVYRHTLACRISPKQVDQWIHFEMGFKLPKEKRFRPERLLFKLYAYLPAGKYEYDNIALRRATPEEMKAINQKRTSIREIIQ